MFQSITEENKLFSHEHRLFIRIDHILNYKINLNKFNRIKSFKVCFLFTMELNEKSTTEQCLKTPPHIQRLKSDF